MRFFLQFLRDMVMMMVTVEVVMEIETVMVTKRKKMQK